MVLDILFAVETNIDILCIKIKACNKFQTTKKILLYSKQTFNNNRKNRTTLCFYGTFTLLFNKLLDEEQDMLEKKKKIKPKVIKKKVILFQLVFAFFLFVN